MHRALGDDDPGQLAQGPDMDRAGEIGRRVEGAAFDAEGRPVDADPVMPDPRAADRAEHDPEAPAAVPDPGPALHLAPDVAEVLGPDDDRDAECRGRLLLAVAAMADIELERRPRELVAHRATLAAAGRDALGHAIPAAPRGSSWHPRG